MNPETVMNKPGLLSRGLVCLCACLVIVGCAATKTEKRVASTAGTMTEKTQAIVEPNVAADPLHIEEGDFVTANYSFQLQTGELIATTRGEMADNPSVQKADWFLRMKEYVPEQLIAGQETLRPELAKAVVGMAAGETKTVELPPERGFGPSDPKNIESYPLEKTFPRTFSLTAQAYAHQFKSFPAVGDEVNFIQYFKSKVVKVDKNLVTLKALAKDGTVISDDFGDTKITLDKDTVYLTLSPKKGAAFFAKGRPGVISKIGETTFDVDYNHPGAGKTLIMDVEIVSFVKSAQYKNRVPEWIEDHDEGYARAAEVNKPMVLILYADWCSWSKRLLNDTVTDPRVQSYWDDFVWTKVDSNKHKQYKEYYGQEGFPMIVLVAPDGEVVKKIGGFQDGRQLAGELKAYQSSSEDKAISAKAPR